MIAPTETTKELVNIQLDGQWVQVPKGMNAIEAAKAFGKLIPHYCYHPKLQVVGNCRMCLIEMGTPKMGPDRKPILGTDGRPEIAWMPRPQIGCATNAAEGMAFRTTSPLIEECRKGVMEFLLINHPLDCPICDQAGECQLQEFSVEFGGEKSRFVENKVKKPKRVDLGERIVLDDERCILCSRCIRFTRDVAKDDCLGFVSRGSHTVLTAHPDKPFNNNYSLNTVDICPVGALTSKDFRFKMRVWFLKETPSICTSCGTGCNTIIGSRENVVHRQTPRDNEAVNECWMCDYGRLNFHYLNDGKRLTQPQVRVKQDLFPTDWEDVLSQAANSFKNVSPSEIAILASARMTNEELFLVKQLQKQLGGDAVLLDVLPRPQKADHLLVCDDGNPNSQGAQLLGVSQKGEKLETLRQGIASGKYRVVLALHEDLTILGISVENLNKIESLISLSLLSNEMTNISRFILPGAGFAEKRGSMINVKGRLQRLNKAIATAGSAKEDWEILNQLITHLGGASFSSIDEVFKTMAATYPVLANLSLSKIGDQGIALKFNS
ncbi:MAG: molybdopterin-dependent oxidoreductase [Verrucomicrobiia bacterium]